MAMVVGMYIQLRNFLTYLTFLFFIKQITFIQNKSVYTRVSYYLDWISANSPSFPYIKQTNMNNNTFAIQTQLDNQNQANKNYTGYEILIINLLFYLFFKF
jgi:hypothetical protein